MQVPFRIVHPLPVTDGAVPTAAANRLASWWLGAGQGVCALVGIAGCGKTTAVDGFLRDIGVLAARRGPAPGPRPGGALLYSLDTGGVDLLFDELADWVADAGLPAPDPVSGLARVARESPDQLLVVIDGLEDIQSRGGVEGVGRLLDPRMRDLVVRCAYGALPGLAMVVTTRLALTDVEVQRLPLYTRIEMDALDEGAAIALLRARGIGGSDRELRRIGEDYGRHALTLDLAARLAMRYGRLPDRGAAADDVLRSYLDLVADADQHLLGLLSLFRRGISTTQLGTVATAVGVELDDGDATIQRLVDLRVLSRVPGRSGDEVLAMHAVLRESVAEGIDRAQRLRWHSAISAALVAEVRARLRELDLTARYDLLEMCVEHAATGADPFSAVRLYWNDIGNFELVGHRDSRFAWGESVCRVLNEWRPPGEVAPALLAEEPGAAGTIFTDWALYLSYLGELAPSVNAHRTAFGLLVDDVQRTIGASNLADGCINRGELAQAREWADEAQRRAFAIVQRNEGMPTREAMRGLDEAFQRGCQVELRTAGANAAQGELGALAYLHEQAAEAIRGWNASMFIPLPDAPEFSVETFQWGVPYGSVLLVRGEHAAAAELARQNLERSLRGSGGQDDPTSFGVRALLAAALLDGGDTAGAADQLRPMQGWARGSDAHHALAEVYLLAARLARLDGELAVAAETVAEGLRTVRETGSGLLHTELLIEAARISLELGEPDDAAYAAATALFGQEPLTAGVALYAAPARDERSGGDTADWSAASGIFPSERTGRPALLAATHHECADRWGEGRARELLAEALLAGLARTSRTARIGGALTASAERVLGYARRLLEQAGELFGAITGTSTDGERLRRRIDELVPDGVLTRFTACLDPPAPTGPVDRSSPRRVLISYTRSDSGFVDALADALEPMVGDVWVDRRRISVGESFVAAINAALRGVTDFVFVLSRDSARSAWVANELDAAIALRNSGAALRIRPVRLDDVEVPALLSGLDIVVATDRQAASVIDRLAEAILR